MRGLGAALLGVLVAASPVSAEAGSFETRLPVRVYRDVDGLPQNTVHTIALDHQGLLWIGTQDGAAVWDTRSWRIVQMPDRATSNFVRAILPAHDGSLWFGTQAGGLHRRIDGRWERHQPRADGLPAARVNGLAEFGSTLVVATYEAGVALFDGERWTHLTSADGLPTDRVWALAPGVHDGVEGVWAACEGGLVFLDVARAKVVQSPAFPRGHANSVVAFAGTDGPETWVGTYGEGVFRLRSGAWRQFGVADGLGSLFATSLAVEHHDEGPRVWIGTDGGGVAVATPDQRFRMVTSVHGLPSDAVYSVLATTAAEGASALWIGTRNGGLARLRELGWQALAPVAEVPEMAITAVAEERLADGGSAYWFGTDGAGVVRRTATSTERWDSSNGLANNFVQALLVDGTDSQREVWVGLRNGGLARLGPAGRVTEVVRAATGDLPHDMIQALAWRSSTTGRELWVGTREGLAIRRGDRWTKIPGLPPVSITSFAAAADGSVWAGSSVGVVHLEGSRFSIIDRRDGLENSGVLSVLEVRGRDDERLLWAGTDGGGLALFAVDDTPRLVTTFGTASEPPLPNDVISAVAQTDVDTVFVLSNRGVAELTLSDPALRYGPAVHVHVFGPEDGLPALAGNRGAILLDHHQRLWVGTVEGAAFLDLASARREDREAKQLVLRGVSVDSQPRGGGLGEEIGLAPDERILRVDFALLSFFREHDSRYRSQLVGLEDHPGSWTESSSREFTGLPPGHYVLHVEGRDFEGNTAVPLTLPIRVSSSLGARVWGYSFPALLVAAAAALILWYQRRGLETSRQAAEERLAKATHTSRRTRRTLVACGLADTLSGTNNDGVLSLLCARPAPEGAALVLFGLRDTTATVTDATEFEERAEEILETLAPDAIVGRFDSAVVWLFWATADSRNPQRWLDLARAGLPDQRTVGAVAVAAPGDISRLPERAASAFQGARQTGGITTG